MLLTKNRTIALVTGILSLAAACSWSGWLSVSAHEQSSAPREQLHGVLSRQKLAPLLRSPARQVRFSPNGSFILVQDESGIRIFTREPLSLSLSMVAPQALPARFSSDSQSLIVTTTSLNVARRDLELDWKNETPVLVPDGCLAAELSPDGELAACYDPEFRLRILRTATGEIIFSDVFGASPPRHSPIPVPRGTEIAFAEPFGYFSAASMKAWIGRRDFALPMAFSPDGRFLLATDSHGDAIAVDISARKRIGIPRTLKKHLGQAWCFATSDLIVALDSKKEGDSAVLAFPGGDRKAQLPVTGSGVGVLSQPRYLRVYSPNAEAPRVFDLESQRFVESLPEGTSDIFKDFAVTYSRDGELLLMKVGENQPRARMMLPLNPLPKLRTAAVSPNLEALALSARGAGGIYRVATGEQVAAFRRMNGAWFANDEKLYVRSRLPDGSLAPVQKLDLKSGQATQVWSEDSLVPSHRPHGDIHPGGPVLLVASLAGLGSVSLAEIGSRSQSAQAYELRALDMQSGIRLWARTLTHDVPVPFADPQGDRLVLGWVATSEAARSEAKQVLGGTGHLKAANLSEHDTFFEVLNARNGKVVGGVLVQMGAGPDDFTSAFSVGDSLILAKDDVRITVFSLSTGRETSRLFGALPAASAEANLLAASDGARLTLYDLKTGTKRDAYLFPGSVAYTHFSADGKRALVLTAHQEVYVLDVSGAAAPAANAAKP